ncbi:MAG: GNAT family N-acetyltransferase [Pseudomonadota bacterium]
MATESGSLLTAYVHCGRDALHDLKTEWLRLEAMSSQAVLFQSHAWCRTAADVMDPEALADIRVFTVSGPTGLVALLPMRLQRKRGRVVLTGLAEPFQEFTDMLLDPQVNAELAYGFIHAEILKQKADYLHLGQVRLDSNLARGIAGRVPTGGEQESAPYVQLSAFSNFAEYLPTVRSKTRKNMRNMKNVLQRTAPLTHAVTRTAQETAPLVDRIYENRSRWLQERGLNSSSFDDEAFRTMVRALAQIEGEAVRPVGMSLRHGDTIIAEMWGFIHNTRYYAYMSSWNKEYSNKGPGRMHLGFLLEVAFDMDVDSAEFMIPAVPYKMTWATHEMVANDHLLPMTLIGQLYVRGWVDFARPRVKALAYAMSDGMRRNIWSAVNAVRGRKAA